MLKVRKANDRGVTRIGWLDSRHTFSFGDYQDPRHHQYRALRVINDDRVAPGGGFPTHPHRDMEILTCVLSGQLEHRDSMGNGEVIRAGEWQAMTAGTGVAHSEFNPSRSEPVHLLQIWLFPDRRGYTPGYQQRVFGDETDRARQEHVAEQCQAERGPLPAPLARRAEQAQRPEQYQRLPARAVQRHQVDPLRWPHLVDETDGVAVAVAADVAEHAQACRAARERDGRTRERHVGQGLCWRGQRSQRRDLRDACRHRRLAAHRGRFQGDRRRPNRPGRRSAVPGDLGPPSRLARQSARQLGHPRL